MEEAISRIAPPPQASNPVVIVLAFIDVFTAEATK